MSNHSPPTGPDPLGTAGTDPKGPPPSVSVIMPAFNAAATIAQGVGSVQAQTWQDWELILVDDASRDATLATVRALAETDPRIRVVGLVQNGGAARARNHAIGLARGRYIAFLDADDLWMPEKLERQLAFMAENGTALCYSGYWREANGVRRAIRIPDRVTRDQLLHGNVIGCLTAVYDTAQTGKVLMPDLRMNQDFGLWLRILALVPEARGLNENLAVYRRQAGSLSASRWSRLKATWTLYRKGEGLSRSRALRCLAAHLVNRLRARL